MTKNIRVRLAPSPTGSLHVGTARTALFNFLFARQHGGSFILRIEDTDKVRSTPEFERDIIEGLRWLGLTWDEGPDCGGEFGPYRQSERMGLYRTALKTLIEKGGVYPCFCTPNELEEERAERQRRNLPPVYSGKCKRLSKDEREQHSRGGNKPIYRFAVQSGTVHFQDLVRGEVTFRTELLGDFSIARGEDDPLYNFAVVVDDNAMQISHVIRGEDHLSNTPKQLLLFRALGVPAPNYAHLPLLLAPNRSKLSKRDAATSMNEYAQKGYLPEAMVNFLSLLGWNPKTEQELFTLQELVKVFQIQNVQKAGAIFDVKKLEHMNAQHLRELAVEELISRGGDRLRAITPKLGHRLRAGVELVRDRLTTLNDLAPALSFLADLPKYKPSLLIPKQGSAEKTKEILDGLSVKLSHLDESSFKESEIRDAITRYLAEQRLTHAQALWPLRVALSGQEKSPGVFAISAALGKAATVKRIQHAIALLAN